MYFQAMNKQENGFEDEFKALPTPQVTGQLGNRPSMRKKNRFKNIVPFDWSRVRLSTTDVDSASEYINASYIPGYKADKTFIAAQGPTECSLDDFIRMIWEQHVPLVVMVTKLVENGKTKCERYLPVRKSDSLTFGHVTIRLTGEDVSPHYVIRTLALEKDGETRVLRHVQFVSWPDHGVPTSPAAFINFHQRARKLYQPDVGPTVVHCSAGVGRTGTFLVMDYLLQQAEAEGRLDVFTCVKTMTEARVSMVQSLDQYVFIHEALLEALHCGQCTLPAAEYVTWWTQVDLSAIKRQFQVLGMMTSPLKPSDTSDAEMEENVTKNRPSVPVPANRWRPILMTPAPGCNDYINAIFVHSYERKHAFIVTQDPLENTRVDLWRLVQDYGCTMVVSLNFDQRSPLCHTEDTLTLGPYEISRHSTNVLDSYSHREIHWKNSDANVHGQVEHLSLSADSDGLPRTEAILAMLDEVKRGLQQSEEDRVLIHCRNGCDISGLVLALHHVCEKLSDEQEVDVFHAVKNIRESRSQFVSTQEEYLWLHQAAADYINQYSTYANFR